MIKVYICEDQKIQLEFWKRTIEEYIYLNNIKGKVVSVHQDPLEILKDTEEYNGNDQYLFFIDIQMPKYDIDGFELAKKLREKSMDYYLVFITAKEKLAYKVFEYQLDILDYIIKKPEYYQENTNMFPIKERLSRIFYKINQKQKEKDKEEQRIQIGSGGRKYEIAMKDIIYVQAIKGTHLIEINVACKKIQVRQTLKEIFDKLDSEEFLFVNKSCIIQKNMIVEFDKKNRKLNLNGGYQLEVSVREMKKICKEMKGTNGNNAIHI